mmetsp:Transcript_26472/g.48024  ORF Transcript_26472/g.48024 Transcript_26472/m.48024 type:complete len:516 (-) Transcript_26472:475-2022(-)
MPSLPDAVVLPTSWKFLGLCLGLLSMDSRLVDCFLMRESYSTSFGASRFTTLKSSIRKNEYDGNFDPGDSFDTRKESVVEKKKRKMRARDFPSYYYNDGSSKKYPKSGKKKFRRVMRPDGTSLLGEQLDGSSNMNLLSELSITYGIPSEPGVAKSASQTRLRKNRSYANPLSFSTQNMTCPPSLNDLSPRPRSRFEEFWISAPARVLSLGVSYLSFPYITKLLEQFVTIEASQLDEIASKFTPGISILYGTFVSLTLSILYNRQTSIQDTVAIESSLITVLLRAVLGLFQNEKECCIEAGQCIADQIRILVRGSRGEELMSLMYSDPYARISELVACREDELFKGGEGGSLEMPRIAYIRDVVTDLMKLRAKRLSDEALALPPTHFFVLTSLTGLILLGYTISILPVVDKSGIPPNESSILFGILCTVYILFYNFINDLNDPFQGVYQIRRSSTASHLLQAKWLIANHPFLRGEVDFEEVEENPSGDILIRSPGLGDLVFEKGDMYPNADHLLGD